MKKNYIFKFVPILFLSICTQFKIKAQFSLQGQMRTRTEIRNGLGNLVLNDAKTAAFTSQRTRLNFGYKWDKVTFGAAVQDVRVWGQDASSISTNDGNRLMLHEGWAEVTLANKADTSVKFKAIDLLTVKIGRQELIYDDVRLIGNLDWLQQARRHDMVLMKAVHKGWQVDLGYAFGQNSDAFGVTGTSYVPANVSQYTRTSTGVLVPTPAGITTSPEKRAVLWLGQILHQPTELRKTINLLRVFILVRNLTKRNFRVYFSKIVSKPIV
jgi:hypothetical protein